MSRALTPAQKRAISILRNSGMTVNVVGVVLPSAPSEAAPRTYATKAERKAGNGFTCTCGRNDLRYEVTPGRSFHFEPDGKTLHDLR